MIHALIWVQAAVLGLSYLTLGLGYVPGLRMNRATIALVSAAVLVSLGTLSLDEAWQAIDADTIVFLLSMMVVNAYLSYAGFFKLALLYLLRLTRSPLGLLGQPFQGDFLSSLALAKRRAVETCGLSL